MLELIINLLKDKNKKTWVSIVKRRIEMVSFIKETYPDYELNESLFLIVNSTVPKIAPCGCKCKFQNGEYTKYCSKPTKPNKDKTNNYCIKCNEAWCNSKKIKTKENCLLKHNVEYHFQREDVKNKSKQTNLEKYGVSHNSQSSIVLCKRKQTFLKNLGVENPFLNEHIVNQIKKTNIERYGFENYGSTVECINSRKSTMLERYGVEHAAHSNIIKSKTFSTKSVSRYNKILSLIKNTNYTELFELDDILYSNNTSMLPFYCNEHGLFYSSYKYSIHCDICHPISVSSIQHEIQDHISSYGISYISNDRNVIFGKEIDIFIPSLKIGIEVNGMYWHKSDIRDSKYHQNKVLKCKEHGIKLIHIFEDEWNNKRDLVCERIKSVLGISKRIYARKCTVNEIQKSTANSFIDEYHIQGIASAFINIGLYYKNDLVAVMTFGKSRFDKKYEYELIRYCSNGTIVGGASKLLKYFERNYNPKSLMTYADMNWSNGNLYEKLGFDYVSTTTPGYFYYDPKSKVRISRQRCQKHKLVKNGHDPSLTETEICCGILGYYKIYDSGNLKFNKYYI